MVIKIRMDCSFFIMILIVPQRKEIIAENPAKIPTIARIGLSKNVSPPLCPDATKIIIRASNKKKPIINPTDHFPSLVLGNIFFIIMTSCLLCPTSGP